MQPESRDWRGSTLPFFKNALKVPKKSCYLSEKHYTLCEKKIEAIFKET